MSVIRERPVERFSEEQYLGSEQKGRVLLLWLAFNSHLASLLKWKTAVFVVLKFSFHVWKYSFTVAMSLLRTSSTVCQSASACIIARSSTYAYCIFSGDGVWQTRDVDVEEKEFQDRSLRNTVLEAS